LGIRRDAFLVMDSLLDGEDRILAVDVEAYCFSSESFNENLQKINLGKDYKVL
jgi:hypothetical protein